MKKQDKLKALGEELGVSDRQARRYVEGYPVPAPRVDMVKRVLGGSTDLWVHPGRRFSKVERFNKWSVETIRKEIETNGLCIISRGWNEK